MSRRGENIYKRKDNRWEGRYEKGREINGKRKLGYVYGRTYRETKIKLLQAQLQVLQKVPEKPDYTIGYLAEQWLLKEKLTVKQSTYAKYRTNIENHILPQMGQVEITELNSMKINLYMEYLKERGRVDKKGGLSAKYIRDIYTILKAIMRYGEKEYGIPEIASNCRIPAKEYKNSRVLSREEQVRMERYLKEDPDDMKKTGVLLCLYTGMRLGEICALRWNAVDTKRGFVKISSTMQRIQRPDEERDKRTQIVLGEPKSRTSQRTVPIPDFLCEMLEKKKREAQCDAFVLTGKTDRFTEPRNYQYHFRRYMSELEMEGIHFHTLRHTFATRCVEAGVDMKSLSEIMGHAGTGITMDCYVHSSDEEKKKQMQKLIVDRQNTEFSDGWNLPILS